MFSRQACFSILVTVQDSSEHSIIILTTSHYHHVDPSACGLHGHGPWVWLPYPCHRYVCSCADMIRGCWYGIEASGLYYLSELVEEHTVFAKRLLTRLIYLVIGIQVLLCLVDGFPFTLSMLSIVSHVVYLGNMRRFPIVKLSDPLFITSCGAQRPPPCYRKTVADPKYSFGSFQPLRLVYTLLQHCSRSLTIFIWQAKCSVLYRDSFILWDMRMACAILPLCVSLRQR